MAQKCCDHSIVQFQRKPPEMGGVLVLGITGGIACGKSLICQFFAELGAVIVSADTLAREAVRPGKPAFKQILDHFGKEILTVEGTIDRALLAQRIFQSPDERLKLNQMTHPAIARLADQQIQKLRKSAGVRLIIYEAPLLFEAKREGSVDLVLVVSSALSQQIERLMRRDNLSREEALQRISAQMPLTEKVNRADIVIENNGPTEETQQLVAQIYRKLTGGKKKNPPESEDFHGA